MLKDTENLIATKIIRANCPILIAETETGRQINVRLSRAQKHDPLFWQIITDILRERIWVPISKKRHQLVADGWLRPQPAMIAAVASDGIFDYNK
ncbi:hypothetical protein [Furfurilactobacillus siliginis]|uniref:Uncharacterized protein n=1 Tax=Furfurilactobacillus siliginis TaxID=348151 RepID=A0A0R2LAP1_9LACO|nr:hypothetical protein [Furfurilactobacillus siliginis]KRN95741.1 hypothetical protein IV55_GL001843 [Furfurilactobacillus siliginis]GEK27997.1 hypothetical protein LSI01_03080 [Furfurilactobacillus siliginis]